MEAREYACLRSMGTAGKNVPDAPDQSGDQKKKKRSIWETGRIDAKSGRQVKGGMIHDL